MFKSIFLICSFLTPSLASFNFLAMGDWGGRVKYPYTTPSELAVAEGMNQVAKDVMAKFVLGIGDNFYSEGVTNVSDPRFQTTFQEVFTPQKLPIPFYMIAGNHDHRGNVQAEIDYTKADPTQRWKYPAPFYSLNFTFNQVKVGILMIDTVILSGSWDNKEPQPLGSHHPLKKVELSWMDNQLKEMKNHFDWLMVAGHYPIYSVGEHGPTYYLVDHLLPMLHKHRVSVYLNGHDHSLQMIQDHHISFVTTGAGHEVDATQAHLQDIPKDSLKFHYPSGNQETWQRGGFVSIQLLDHKKGHVIFYNQNGTMLYTHHLRNHN